MAFNSNNARRAFAADRLDAAPSTLPLYARLEDLLASGGDGRICLAKGRNKYGCAPFPQDTGEGFSSSTASSISGAAYARAGRARMALLAAAAIDGVGEAFAAAVARGRDELKQILRLPDKTGVIFAASGTDAQLSALFLARARLAGPITVIIVGADQTGGGTVHTARGRHFDNRTARDIGVAQGHSIPTLGDALRCVDITLADGEGRVRSPDELERLVRGEAEEAIERGDKILLQAMDASKLGWRGPGLGFLKQIGARWPGQIQIVVDACQLRCGRSRLKAYLDQGFMVLITGSKFFTGPAFSGALLTPASLDAALGAAPSLAGGLRDYSSRHDWPEHWPLRDGFCAAPNYGQWLRWEAALAEMAAYYAVPAAVRQAIAAKLARDISGMLKEAPFLMRVDGAAPDRPRDIPTIFSFQPQRSGQPLSAADCVLLYRALGANIASLLPSAATAEERQMASRRSQIGQPVCFGAGAVLRLAISARQIRACCRDDALDAAAITEARGQLVQTIAKMELILRHFDSIAEHFQNA